MHEASCIYIILLCSVVSAQICMDILMTVQHAAFTGNTVMQKHQLHLQVLRFPIKLVLYYYISKRSHHIWHTFQLLSRSF